EAADKTAWRFALTHISKDCGFLPVTSSTVEVAPLKLSRPSSPAPAGNAGGVVDVLEARPGRVRRIHRRPGGGRGAALHAPLAARAGRGSLPALRHADDRQGRHPAVLTSCLSACFATRLGGVPRASLATAPDRPRCAHAFAEPSGPWVSVN